MKEKTCCFTGHRRIPEKDYAVIKEGLEKIILELYNKGIRFFEAGGALGFDTLAAESVLRLRESCPELRLILVLPCLDQTKGWKAGDVERYEEIKRQADKTVYTGQEYTPGCMHTRNRRLVDDSSVCVCYQTRSRGGTAYTVDYAKKKGLKAINLA